MVCTASQGIWIDLELVVGCLFRLVPFLGLAGAGLAAAPSRWACCAGGAQSRPAPFEKYSGHGGKTIMIVLHEYCKVSQVRAALTGASEALKKFQNVSVAILALDSMCSVPAPAVPAWGRYAHGSGTAAPAAGGAGLA